MTEFPSVKPNKKSISFRTGPYGIGVNDADYMVMLLIDGKTKRCPFYVKWLSMLERCHSKKLHASHPSYKGCLTCDDWLTFSNFRSWMVKQDWQGKHLDKDIITPGNKEYSPDNCCFISIAINSLLTGPPSSGKNPRGVSFDSRKNTYQARVTYNGERVNLGLYKSQSDAALAYIKGKSAIIFEAALNCSDTRVSEGLKRHANILLASI